MAARWSKWDICVAASGCAALIDQVVWQRLLATSLGSDIRAVSVVCAAFLAGTALGSIAGGRADRLSRLRCKLWLSATLLAVAAFSLLSRWLFYDVAFALAVPLSGRLWLAHVLALAGVLMPAILMGVTLPMAVRCASESPHAGPAVAGRLYGVNTLGAALGSLVSGFLLIGNLGIDGTLLTAAGLSLVAALVPWIRASWREIATRARRGAAPPASHPPFFSPLREARAFRVWCGLALIAGFVGLSLEILWFRFLNVLLQSNAYTFSYLLGLLLIGAGMGSLAAAKVAPRLRSPMVAFLALQACTPALAAAMLLLGVRITSAWNLRASYTGLFDRLATIHDQSTGAMVVLYAVLPPLVLLPPAFLLGAVFPLSQAAQRSGAHGGVARRAGTILGMHMAGNVAGSLVTGLVLLDMIGTAGVAAALAVLGILFATLLILEGERAGRGAARLGWAAAAAGTAVACLMPVQSDFWSPLHGTRSGESFLCREDSTGLAAVRETGSGFAVVFANGRDQAKIPFIVEHLFLGAVPALVHPSPERILAIGVGSGGTPYALGVRPETKRVLAVEIIGAELPALHRHAARSGDRRLEQLLQDKRYRFVVGDGRRRLAESRELFDIIEADAIPPGASRSGLLYSREYFLAARRRLAPGGLMAQWRASERVARTFASVFPHVVDVGGFLLMGSETPIHLDKDRLIARLRDPEVRRYLEISPEDLERVRDKWLRQPVSVLAAGSPLPPVDIESDLRPRGEYFLN